MVFTHMITLTASERQRGEDDRGFCERWEAGLDAEKAVWPEQMSGDHGQQLIIKKHKSAV